MEVRLGLDGAQRSGLQLSLVFTSTTPVRPSRTLHITLQKGECEGTESCLLVSRSEGRTAEGGSWCGAPRP